MPVRISKGDLRRLWYERGVDEREGVYTVLEILDRCPKILMPPSVSILCARSSHLCSSPINKFPPHPGYNSSLSLRSEASSHQEYLRLTHVTAAGKPNSGQQRNGWSGRCNYKTYSPCNQLYLGGIFLVKRVAATTMSSDANIITGPESSKCDDIPMLQLFANLNEINNKPQLPSFCSRNFSCQNIRKKNDNGVPSKKRNKQTDLPWLHPHPNDTVDRVTVETCHTPNFANDHHLRSPNMLVLGCQLRLPRFGEVGWMELFLKFGPSIYTTSKY